LAGGIHDDHVLAIAAGGSAHGVEYTAGGGTDHAEHLGSFLEALLDVIHCEPDRDSAVSARWVNYWGSATSPDRRTAWPGPRPYGALSHAATGRTNRSRDPTGVVLEEGGGDLDGGDRSRRHRAVKPQLPSGCFDPGPAGGHPDVTFGQALLELAGIDTPAIVAYLEASVFRV
jgi:hypothetical protein